VRRNRHNSSRRHSRAVAPREKSELAGPMREVVYIFKREGVRGGAIWMLVLECGHFVARKRHEAKELSAIIHAMLEPIERRLAPRRAQCHFCGSGGEKCDPWVTIQAFGGPTP